MPAFQKESSFCLFMSNPSDMIAETTHFFLVALLEICLEPSLPSFCLCHTASPLLLLFLLSLDTRSFMAQNQRLNTWISRVISITKLQIRFLALGPTRRSLLLVPRLILHIFFFLCHHVPSTPPLTFLSRSNSLLQGVLPVCHSQGVCCCAVAPWPQQLLERKTFNWGSGLQFQKFSPLSSWRGAWWRAGRYGNMSSWSEGNMCTETLGMT